MADKPDAIIEGLLEPGERVVYRDGGVRRCQISFDRTAGVILCVAGVLLCVLGGVLAMAGISWKYVLVSLVLGPGLVGLGLAFVREWRQMLQIPPRPHALVTETRALYWNETTSPVPGEIQLSDIAAAEKLSSDEGGVRIEKRDGSAAVWTDLENPDCFAGHLRPASGLESSWPAHRFEVFDLLSLFIAYSAVFFLPGVLTIAKILITGANPQGLEWLSTIVFAVFGAAAICFAGLHIARLSLLLGRWRRHSPEAVRCWLGPHQGDRDLERRVRLLVLLNPLYRRLASALYGETIWPSAAGAARHG